MGAWSAEIIGNDTSADIYQTFFDLHNQGLDPVSISRQIQDEFSETFEDEYDRNNGLFALALAQWETKSLDPEIYQEVKEIIMSGKDIELWESLGGDTDTIKQRKTELDNFLAQISTIKEKQEYRGIKPKFELVSLLNVIAPDNLKMFHLNEEYTDKSYTNTSGLMMWGSGGGSVLYFIGQHKRISAKWVDNQTLEITHDKDIVFTMQNDNIYHWGDDIKVIYKPE